MSFSSLHLNPKQQPTDTRTVTKKHHNKGVSKSKGNKTKSQSRYAQWQKTTKEHTREDSTHGHQQMVNTEIRLIIFFVAKDGEALYSQQKQDQELTVA